MSAISGSENFRLNGCRVRLRHGSIQHGDTQRRGATCSSRVSGWSITSSLLHSRPKRSPS